MRTSGRALGLVMAVLALATLAGCKTDTTTTASTSAGGASVAATALATPAAGVTEAPPASPSGIVTRPAAGTPAAGRAGEPNRALTPGHAFASATTSQVCVSGYSRSVRYVTTAVREQVFAIYHIGYPPPAGAYERVTGGRRRHATAAPRPRRHRRSRRARVLLLAGRRHRCRRETGPRRGATTGRTPTPRTIRGRARATVASRSSTSSPARSEFMSSCVPVPRRTVCDRVSDRERA